MRKIIQNQRWPKGWNIMIKFWGAQKAIGVNKSWSKGKKINKNKIYSIFLSRVPTRDLA